MKTPESGLPIPAFHFFWGGINVAGPDKRCRAFGPTDIAGPLALQILPGFWPYRYYRASGPMGVVWPMALDEGGRVMIGRFGRG